MVKQFWPKMDEYEPWITVYKYQMFAKGPQLVYLKMAVFAFFNVYKPKISNFLSILSTFLAGAVIGALVSYPAVHSWWAWRYYRMEKEEWKKVYFFHVIIFDEYADDRIL